MSETLSQAPRASRGFLSDILVASQGTSTPGTGNTRGLRASQVLGANGLIYAGDPAYGVVADGVTDDTAAWALAFAAAQATGAAVVAPVGVSVGAIAIPANVALIGRNVQSFSASLGSQTLGSVIKSTSALVPAISMASFSQMQNIQVSGNGAQPCISSTGAIDLFDVDAFGGSAGIDFGFGGAHSEVTKCRFHECGTGILNPVDVGIIGCRVSGSTANGIALGNGCNKNRIVGTRVEGSALSNLLADGTGGFNFGNVITGNSFDGAGGNNVLLRLARNATLAGNDFGRAGRSQAGSPGGAADASIYLQNCNGVAISGNTSWVGRDDGGTGYVGPFFAVYDGGSNVNCVIATNVLPYHNNAGAPTTGPINITSTFNLAAALNQVFWSA